MSSRSIDHAAGVGTTEPPLSVAVAVNACVGNGAVRLVTVIVEPAGEMVRLCAAPPS